MVSYLLFFNVMEKKDAPNTTDAPSSDAKHVTPEPMTYPLIPNESGGALKLGGRDGFLPDGNLYGFLSLAHHSYKDTPGTANINLVDMSKDGQWELCFCQFERLQTFFDRMVEDFKHGLSQAG